MKYIIVIGSFLLFFAAVVASISGEMNKLPFVIDFLLGFTASALSPRPALRLIGWFVIPLVVAFISFNPRAFLGPGQLEGITFMGIFYFGYLLVIGLAAAGVGTVLGYFLRRFLTARS